ncbi:PIN domain-containing protein, partial [Burkholderia ubonensis]|uniref:PIN domain-containing protein n=1 Tax=Burkholderia ubonensis TaxID=101571 RepID=UPI0012FC5BDE
QDHEHDISNAPPAVPVYTVSNFNSLLEAGALLGVVAQQVTLELQDHLDTVAGEARNALTRFVTRVERIDAIAKAFGTNQVVDLAHFDGHVSKARLVVERWISVAEAVPQSTDIPALAWARMLELRTPAQKGKDSMKDCVVIETYLDAVKALRNSGLSSRIVFLSSNIKDYTGKESGGLLNADLGKEFANLNIDYARNASQAKYLLGL